MRLFIKEDNNEIGLRVLAPTRNMLRQQLGGNQFMVNDKRYQLDKVYAKTSHLSSDISMLFGGFIGILGSFPGIIGGAILGPCSFDLALS